MDQKKIYNAIALHDFKVKIFSDYPSFFSCWSITITKNKFNYLIEHEGRDGWLIFYREIEPNKYEELDRKSSHPMSDQEQVDQCEAWLSAVI